MDYQYYTVSDFISDEKFRQWVRSPAPDSNRFWENWLSQHPERAQIVEEARLLLLGMANDQDVLYMHEQKQLWDKISRQISDAENEMPLQKVVPLSHRTAVHHQNVAGRKNFWTNARISFAAASVLILFALGLVYYLSIPADVPPVSTMVTRENPWGQRSTIYLSDGTEVTLNAGSSMSYEKDFSAHERVVKLQGEAFFEVAKDPLRPFSVRTGDITTQALGTSFNVKAYPQQQVEVALVTGKVSVQKTLATSVDSLLLTPGEHVVYKPEESFNKSSFDPKKVLSWKEGIIYFDHASEAYVFETLERWYGVKINVRNTPSKEWNYTASFDKRSLEHVLMSIGFAMDFQCEINQKSITIKYN